MMGKLMSKPANYITHIALVLDASTSMVSNGKHHELITVADSQIAHFAQRSKELDHEIRVSVYTFSYYHNIQCVIFDKDVLRLPSIKNFYSPYGMTALIDATLKSQDDLEKTAQMYGDHAFLTYILTDGNENNSRNSSSILRSRLEGLSENWTVACLVPDQSGFSLAKKYGFPVDNIAIWDATSAKGVVEVGETIRQATDTFLDNRSKGVRGSKTLFSTSIGDVNKQTIKAAKLKALPKSKYQILDVDEAAPIRDWVQGKGIDYRLGIAFYQLTKTESIQAQKNIVVREKKTGKFYAGAETRNILGLKQDEERVTPDYNPDFDVFVQSTSVNRKLVPGTTLLLLK